MSVNEVGGKGGGGGGRTNEGTKDARNKRETERSFSFPFFHLPSCLYVCLSVCRSIRCFVAPVISPATYLFPPPRAHRTLAPTDEMASEHALTNLSLSLSLSLSVLSETRRVSSLHFCRRLDLGHGSPSSSSVASVLRGVARESAETEREFR